MPITLDQTSYKDELKISSPIHSNIHSRSNYRLSLGPIKNKSPQLTRFPLLRLNGRENNAKYQTELGINKYFYSLVLFNER